MSPFRLGLLVATLGACASARNEPTGDVDAAIDANGSGSRDAASTGCAQPFSGVLATWDFSGEAGNQASTAVKTTAPGVVAGAVQRAPGLTAITGANAINSSNWALAAQPDLTKYYALTIAPPNGCTLALTMVSIDAKASNTGPAMGGVATSVEGYAKTTAVSTAAPSSATLMPPPQVAPIELRVYGYGATAVAGTLRLQTTLSISGALQ
jgi:hypothetical protein